MNYRIWNFDTGICIDSDIEALTPQDALEKSIRHPLSSIQEGGRYLVAKQGTGPSGNHNEFGIFKAKLPTKPRLTAERVTL